MPEFAALLRLASDQRLAEHVSAGSERAFEVLYDRHHRPVLAFCRHMLGSRDEAEDAVQHTFMAAYRDLLRTGPPAAVRPWLFVIARNRCISVLRARREHPAENLPEPATDHLASDVVAREELRAVLAGVARLPDDQRAALVLAELGDVSHDEIARILDCRRDQVKSYVYLARTSLLADRAARETSCADIREQLAVSTGGQLRRAPLRRHLHACEGCREFREALRGQRRALGVLFPVAPSLGLKQAVLSASLGGGGGATGLTLGGVAATVLVVVAIPAGGAAVAQHPESPPTRERVVAAPARATAVPTRSATQVVRSGRSRPRKPVITRPRRERPVRPSHATTEPARPRAVSQSERSRSETEPSRTREPSEPTPTAPDPSDGRPATREETPTTSPSHDKPKTTPAPRKPDTPPGKPDEPPGKPDTPPGKPDEPHGKPEATPGNGPPEPATATPQRQAPEGHEPPENPGRSRQAPAHP